MLDLPVIDRKLLKKFDIRIVIIPIMIVFFGCMNIYSATVNKSGSYYLKRQLLWFAASLIVCFIIALIKTNVLFDYAPVLYWGSILLLIYNDLTSKPINGARCWIYIGNTAIQPSEFAKLAMILMLARRLKNMEGKVGNLKNFIILTMYALIPMLLIVVQPDMGMTMICFFIVVGIYFIMGLDLRVFIAGFFSVVVTIMAAWNSPLMAPHWRDRINSFLNPGADEMGVGMQLAFAKIGIGAGNIFGYGAKFGSDSGTGFVTQWMPEVWTDFIFSVVGEKWGFVGAIGLLSLYAILLYGILRAAYKCGDIFGEVICIGVFSSFLFSVVQNVGMNIGIMPITGLTLPFMSYGGSSLMTYFIALGMVLNVGIHREKPFFKRETVE